MKRFGLFALIITLSGLLLACGGSAGNSGGSESAHPTVPATGNQSATLPAGTITSVAFHSSVLNKSMGFAIYLPAGYTPTTHYPVLYMLYGYGGNPRSVFGGFLDLNSVADQPIAAHVIAPLIISPAQDQRPVRFLISSVSSGTISLASPTTP